MVQFIFYLSFLALVYTYFGYPLLLFFLSLVIKKQVDRGDILPDVAVIIPVHNEEKIIEDKIQTCLRFNYPEEKLKIIVVSDGSTDRTEEIVKQYSSDQVHFLSTPFRGGKVAAQNYAVRFFNPDVYILRMPPY